ncbi:MAG: ABC transporter ATP-binding protein [Litorivicinaceae bacterium]
MSTETLIRLDEVSFGFGEGASQVAVLTALSWSIRAGQRIALLGRSGSGKSTLMNLLAGLLLPSSGTIYWADQAIDQLSESERVAARRQLMGVVYQFHHLLPEFSALENVMLPALLSGYSVKQAAESARALLSAVDLSTRETHRPGELSGGERQRVAIARALAAQPRILLMDEPTGNLDEDTADRVLNLLFSLSLERDLSLLIVTHDRRAAAMADQQWLLQHGQLQPA